MITLALQSLLVLAAAMAAGPTAKVIRLEPAGKAHMTVLSGPPETATMRSGLVTLEPGKSIGLHSTGANEELLVVLEGSGEFRLEKETLPLVAGSALYCPSGHTHDVVNTGKTTLRYVYITSSTRVMPTSPGMAH